VLDGDVAMTGRDRAHNPRRWPRHGL